MGICREQHFEPIFFNFSTSSGHSGNENRFRSLRLTDDLYKIETDENEYETLPPMAHSLTHRAVVSTSNVGIDFDVDVGVADARQDTSVISAQHPSSNFGEPLRPNGLTQQHSIDPASGYFYVRKNLLMTDANETRL